MHGGDEISMVAAMSDSLVERVAWLILCQDSGERRAQNGKRIKVKNCANTCFPPGHFLKSTTHPDACYMLRGHVREIGPWS